MMTAAQDQQLLAEFIAVCRSGYQFYQAAAASMEDVELKMRLQEMAALRSSIACQLRARYASSIESPAGQPLHRESQQRYQQLLLQLNDYDDSYFFAELSWREARVLRQLRQQVRALHSPDLAINMAFHLASMQIAHDQLWESLPGPSATLH